MADSSYEVQVARQPALFLIGVKVATNMERAATDCPGIWHDTFGPRMCEVPLDGELRSYGVSYATDMATGAFDYWAAMPAAEDAAVPSGMETVRTPAGLYAECWIDNLALLSGAYQFIYSEWLPKQADYVVEPTHPSYELYPADYMQNGRMALYFPVKKA